MNVWFGWVLHRLRGDSDAAEPERSMKLDYELWLIFFFFLGWRLLELLNYLNIIGFYIFSKLCKVLGAKKQLQNFSVPDPQARVHGCAPQK